MNDRADIIAKHPLVPFMEARGAAMRGTGKTLTTNRCAGSEHKEGHQCVNVDTEKEVWYCNDCQVGGSVIDFLAIFEGIPIPEALKRMGGTNGSNGHSAAPLPKPANGAKPPGKLVKTYDYTDEDGKLLFVVGRYEPKDFRQKAPDGNGGWIYKLDGVRRVPYNLPKVIAADFVFICEGEKDADTITSMGFVGTTNCGGAKKWLPEYCAFFRGKSVAILPDNDEKGKEHRDLLREQLGKVVKSMRIVEMPEGIKDISELAATFTSITDAKNELLSMADKVETLYRGELVPVQTMDELEDDYKAHIKRAATHQLPLGQWLPSFGHCVRPLVPGELVTILAGTGCGKTMLLQNLAISTRLETLLFETELPGTLSFERFAAMATESSGGHVDSTYRMDQSVRWRESGKLAHISCCHLSRLTTEQITKIINTAELKTTKRPVLVLIDYIQLVQGSGDRYERVSGVAEQLKIVAKETNTIIVMASQIGRTATGKNPKETTEVSLTDGKESGSIENSSGLVIGAWRDGTEANKIWLRILKNTKGVAGRTIPCRISESLLIREEPKQNLIP